MHAVIRTGGKQYYVTAGDILEVEKLAGNIGDTIELADVLMLAGNGDVTVGQPTVDGAAVTAKITGQYRGTKIQVFRYRPKKRIRVRKGHRQYLTRLHVQTIRLADGSEYQVAAPTVTVAATPIVETPVVDETPVAVEPMAEADAVDSTGDSAPAVESENTAESENKE
jgi:large subunit ribosomal protein L21